MRNPRSRYDTDGSAGLLALGSEARRCARRPSSKSYARLRYAPHSSDGDVQQVPERHFRRESGAGNARTAVEVTRKLGKIAHALARARMLLDAHGIWPSKTWERHKQDGEENQHQQR